MFTGNNALTSSDDEVPGTRSSHYTVIVRLLKAFEIKIIMHRLHIMELRPYYDIVARARFLALNTINTYQGTSLDGLES